MTTRNDYERSITVKNSSYTNSLGTTIVPETHVTREITDYLSSGNSPRINGKLQLKQNTLSRRLYKLDKPPHAMRGGSVGYSQIDYASAYQSISRTDPPNLMVLPPPADDESYRSASNAFYSSLGSVEAGLGQIFAERQQTIDMVGGRIRDLYNIASSLKRGRNPFRRNHKISTKDFANTWLEYSYGWVPLLNDIYDLIELKDLSPPSQVVKTTRSVKKNGKALNPPVMSGCSITGIVVNGNISISTIYTTTCRASVRVDQSSLSFLQRVGLANPALLIWELLPYSFVIDWFYPVGNWLENQTADLGLSFSDTSVTRTRKTFVRYNSSISIHPVLAKYGYYASGSSSATLEQLEKYRNLTLPIKVPPRIKNPLSVSHAVSALSLLRQLFR